jgi:hypothetical protein
MVQDSPAPRREAKDSSEWPCLVCSRRFDIGDLYSLDECSHRFCRPCLSCHIIGRLQEGLSSEVGCPTCGASLFP